MHPIPIDHTRCNPHATAPWALATTKEHYAKSSLPLAQLQRHPVTVLTLLHLFFFRSQQSSLFFYSHIDIPHALASILLYRYFMTQKFQHVEACILHVIDPADCTWNCGTHVFKKNARAKS